MKQRITTLCLVACLLIFLQVIDLMGTIVNFVLVGELPGLNTPVSPVGMIVFWTITALGTSIFVASKKWPGLPGKFVREIRRHVSKRQLTNV